MQRALSRRRTIERELARVQRDLQTHRRVSAWGLAHLAHDRAKLISPLILGPTRWTLAHGRLRSAASRVRERLRGVTRKARRRSQALRRERDALTSWLGIWGVFLTCPVAGPNTVADNFGITVRLPEVPVHRHMGNDISAATGTPIVAPFDGYAAASSSPLGGAEVRVSGARGYVYNAHLSSYGRLGYVHAGEVVGYVGITGDATASHDHFEWHPGGGAAVDPNPLLSVVC